MVQKTRGAHESNALCDIMIYENIKYFKDCDVRSMN